MSTGDTLDKQMEERTGAFSETLLLSVRYDGHSLIF